MSRKATIDNLFARKTEGGTSAVADPGRVRTGAIAAMGTSLKELTESALSASKMQEQLESGDAVIEIDPADVDASMVNDRLVAEIDPDFDDLVESIRNSGQQVPILVRPNPASPARYQIAYGRRRMRAAAKIGAKVRAIVKEMTDSELVIAQGKENLDRKDLSFIEKAMFARQLEEQGFERLVIMAALSTDKGDLSRYITVAKTIPQDVVQAIGPAGKAGRARWIALGEKLATGSAPVRRTLQSEEFKKLDSDGRFAMLFNSLTERRASSAQPWVNDRGQKAGQVEQKSDRVVVTIDERVVPDFGSYLAGRLDELYAEFLKRKEDRAA